MLIKVKLHDQTDTQAESVAATISTVPVAPDVFLSTTPAVGDVFSTTELLEQILSHFDIKDLLLLRQVSRHWRDVMAGSLVLQRAMFLAPEPAPLFEWHLKHRPYDEPYRLVNEPYHYIQKQFATALEIKSGYKALKSCQLNPLFFERKPNDNTDEMSCTHHSHRFSPRHPLKDFGASKLFSRMLIAQPPVTFIQVGCRTKILNIKGVRISDVAYAMGVKGACECRLGHIFSITAMNAMLPSREEEKAGQIIRQASAWKKLCAIIYKEHFIIRDSTSESGYRVTSA